MDNIQKISELIKYFHIEPNDYEPYPKCSPECSPEDIIQYMKSNYNHEVKLNTDRLKIFNHFDFITQNIDNPQQIKLHNIEYLNPSNCFTSKKFEKFEKFTFSEIKKISFCFNQDKEDFASGNQEQIKKGFFGALLIYYKKSIKDTIKDNKLLEFNCPLNLFNYYIYNIDGKEYKIIQPTVAGNNRWFGCKLFEPLIDETCILEFQDLTIYEIDTKYTTFLKTLNLLLEKLSLNYEMYYVEIFFLKNDFNNIGIKFFESGKDNLVFLEDKIAINDLLSDNFTLINNINNDNILSPLKSKKSSIDMLKSLLDPTITAMILSSLISGYVVYHFAKEDNRKNQCIQTIRTFDVNNYNKKDLKILVDDCPNEVKEYEILGEILFDTNDTNKLSATINQLYVHNKINEEIIIDFSDNILMNNIHNENYNYDSVYESKQNNLPTLDKQIGKYLQFTKEILFRSYTNEQLNNYLSLFLILFKNQELINNKQTYDDLKSKKRSHDLEINPQFTNLQKIINNVGKIEQNKLQIKFVLQDDKFVIALNELYVSYMNKNSKNILINKLNLFSNLIANNIKRNNINMTQANSIKNINEIFYSEKIIQLILHELATYKLNDQELKTIFSEYARIINFINIFNQDITSKLVHKLFIHNNDLYNHLFLENYENLQNTLSSEFISYLGIYEQITLLNILKINNKDEKLKKNIFNVILEDCLSHQNTIFFGESNSINIIINLIREEKNQELQKTFLRSALLINDYEIFELAIEYINKYKLSCLSELNRGNDTGISIPIFKYLVENKSLLLSKERIFNLLLDFMQKTTNKESKLLLLDNIIKIIDKKDGILIEKLRKTISKEKDPFIKQKMFDKIIVLN